MPAIRTLLAVLTAGLAAGAGAAQVGLTPPPPPPLPSAAGLGNPLLAPPPAGTANPIVAPPAQPGTGPSATGVLTAPAGLPAAGSPLLPGTGQPLPPGAYAGPYCGPNAAGCNGPVGANGPVTYELYVHTGPSIIVGGDKELMAALGSGWALSGGARTLHFNPAGDAAWVLTTGIAYLYSGGPRDYIGVGTRPAPFFDPNNQNDPRNGQILTPDQINAFRVKSFNRTAFEWAIGRDWWLNGPAAVGYEQGWNSRVGVDVGGRWGTASISLRPLDNPDNYFRKSDVFHAVTLGAHYTAEVPMGAWIGFVGGRVQWAYNWSNVVPPVGGNTQDVGILFTGGVRF